MKNESITRHITDRQDSMYVNRNANEEYSFGVKIYFDSNKDSLDKTISRIDSIYKKLKKKFK